MDHFNNDLGPGYRYKNEMLEHMRKQTTLLEQIAEKMDNTETNQNLKQMLETLQSIQKDRKEGGSHADHINKQPTVHRPSQRQQGQRNSHSYGTSKNKSKS